MDVPLLEADLDTTPVAVSFASAVECVKGGNSFPLTFDIGTFPPLGDLTITLTNSITDAPKITTETGTIKL
ncbi:MAG: hypothetical protein QF535_05555 [Anaerolineales bacterium]|nr:hypothetical protein [Anaerolineales bacterium]